jgi:hypothetical protein
MREVDPLDHRERRSHCGVEGDEGDPGSGLQDVTSPAGVPAPPFPPHLPPPRRAPAPPPRRASVWRRKRANLFSFRIT